MENKEMDELKAHKLKMLRETTDIINSGYAGMMPGTGMIVDRRKHPEAIPCQENEMLATPPPVNLLTAMADGLAGAKRYNMQGMQSSDPMKLEGDVVIGLSDELAKMFENILRHHAKDTNPVISDERPSTNDSEELYGYRRGRPVLSWKQWVKMIFSFKRS